MRKSLSGNRRTLVAKCFTIHCCDFKTVRLTFMDCNQSTQLFGTNFAENFKESILLPYSKPTNGEILSENEKSPLTPVLPRIKVLQAEDKCDDKSDTSSLSEDDDVEEGEELGTEGLGRSYGSSTDILKREFFLIFRMYQLSIN